MDTDRRDAIKGVMELECLTTELLKFQRAKDAQYDGSWARRGLVGYLYGCLLRQIDRIEPGVRQVLKVVGDDQYDDLSPEAVLEPVELGPKDAVVIWVFMDTLVDVAMYSLLGLRLLATYWPEVFNQFMVDIETVAAGESGLVDKG